MLDGQGHRAKDLAASRMDLTQPCLLAHDAFLRQSSKDVVNHHDRAIHEQSKIDGTEAHEVSGKSGLHHPAEGDQHRQRNSGRHDHACAEIAEEEEQHCHDEESTLKQIVTDSAHHLRDKDGPVVVGFDCHTRGKGCFNLSHSSFDTFNNLLRILARQHLDHADDGFTFSHRGRRADAECRRLLHLSEV